MAHEPSATTTSVPGKPSVKRRWSSALAVSGAAIGNIGVVQHVAPQPSHGSRRVSAGSPISKVGPSFGARPSATACQRSKGAAGAGGGGSVATGSSANASTSASHVGTETTCRRSSSSTIDRTTCILARSTRRKSAPPPSPSAGRYQQAYGLYCTQMCGFSGVPCSWQRLSTRCRHGAVQ